MAAVFSPTNGEVTLVNQIFAKHDPKKYGIITNDLAVNIFRGANVMATTLSQICGIADADNQGFLTRKGVSVAVRLVGWAQNDEDISAELVNKRERDKSSPPELYYSSWSKLAPSPSLMGFPPPPNLAGLLAPSKASGHFPFAHSPDCSRQDQVCAILQQV
jgi:epidermal growth factor receptor substrate 15